MDTQLLHATAVDSTDAAEGTTVVLLSRSLMLSMLGRLLYLMLRYHQLAVSLVVQQW